MAFEKITCIVAHVVNVDNLAGDGNSVNSSECLGYFETIRDADQLLADEGFTRSKWSERSWEKYMQRAYVRRTVIEVK